LTDTFYTRRKPGLGNYNVPKNEWACAYRRARTRYRQGFDADETGTGIEWKAELIVNYERHARDKLDFLPSETLCAKRLIDELLEDEK